MSFRPFSLAWWERRMVHISPVFQFQDVISGKPEFFYKGIFFLKLRGSLKNKLVQPTDI
jgi:hypothetical protein